MLKSMYQIRIINSLGIKQDYFISAWSVKEAIDYIQTMIQIEHLLKVKEIA